MPMDKYSSLTFKLVSKNLVWEWAQLKHDYPFCLYFPDVPAPAAPPPGLPRPDPGPAPVRRRHQPARPLADGAARGHGQDQGKKRDKDIKNDKWPFQKYFITFSRTLHNFFLKKIVSDHFSTYVTFFLCLPVSYHTSIAMNLHIWCWNKVLAG